MLLAIDLFGAEPPGVPGIGFQAVQREIDDGQRRAPESRRAGARLRGGLCVHIDIYISTTVGSSSGWGDDGCPAATDEANRQNLPAIAAPSRAEKCNGVQSRIAVLMELANAALLARPPLDRTKTIVGSPMTAPSRVKPMRTVT